MSYYGQRGNYAAGDNYGRAGNYPYQAGGIFDVIGKIGKGIVGAASGFIQGGPVGALTGAARAFAPSPKQSVAAPRIMPPPSPIQIQPYQPRQALDIRGPFGTGIGLGPVVTGPAPVIAQMDESGHCGPKFRQAFRRVDSWLVRTSRRMNVLNARALRKAGRRVSGFTKLARRMGAYAKYGVVRKRGRAGTRRKCK